MIALGHGLVEIPLIFLLFFGLSEFFRSAMVQKTVSLLGSSVLIILGFQMFRNHRKICLKPQRWNMVHYFLDLLQQLQTRTFFLWWATVGATLIFEASVFDYIGIALFTIVHWSCDLAWYTFVAFTIFKSRRFWTRKVFEVVFLFCFIVLTAFGIWFLVSAFLW